MTKYIIGIFGMLTIATSVGGCLKGAATLGRIAAKTAPPARVVRTAPLSETTLNLPRAVKEARPVHTSPDDVSALPKSELSLTDEAAAAKATDDAADSERPGFFEKATKKVTKKVAEEAVMNIDKFADRRSESNGEAAWQDFDRGYLSRHEPSGSPLDYWLYHPEKLPEF